MEMKMKLRLVVIGALMLMAGKVSAQVANPSGVTFVSTDQTTTIPAGQTNAGQPTLSQYQASLFPVAADPASGVPISVGPVIAKTLAALQPSPAPANTYKLTMTQMGLTVPACTALPCPQYTIVVVAIGPNGTSAKAVASESDPFTAALPVVGPPPAAPTSVHPVP